MMGRLPIVVFALTVLVHVSLYLIPFKDRILELQPDGKNLGTIPGEYFRLATLAVLSIPLIGAALYCIIAERYASTEHLLGSGALLIIGGFWVVTILFRRQELKDLGAGRGRKHAKK